MKNQITGEIFSIQSMMDDLCKLGLQAGMHVIVYTSYGRLRYRVDDTES
jgi:aminoglycoside N3'-acetyltransferase